jgi:hypothetical protein
MVITLVLALENTSVQLLALPVSARHALESCNKNPIKNSKLKTILPELKSLVKKLTRQ